MRAEVIMKWQNNDVNHCWSSPLMFTFLPRASISYRAGSIIIKPV